jgi:Putative Ig domain
MTVLELCGFRRPTALAGATRFRPAHRRARTTGSRPAALLYAALLAPMVMAGCALGGDLGPPSKSGSGSPASSTPLSVSTSAVGSGSSGQAYSGLLAATGGTAPYAWSITSGALPTGLSLGASTGAIAGVPGPTGTFVFTAQVKDSSSTPQTASAQASLVVTASLLIVTTSLPTAQIQTSYSVTLAASGGDPGYTWSVSAGSLPAGLSLNASTGVVSGTPTAAGTSAFTVRVVDSSSPPQAASEQFSASVSTSPSTLSISTSALVGGISQKTYTAGLAASGGTAPYSWSVVSASLPAGLTLNASTGQVSGTPTATGTSNFTVQVRDSSTVPQTASAALSILIVGVLQITTSSLPAPQMQQAYNASVGMTGGIAPYVWSVSSGGLPPGLSLNATGVITGTPTTAGAFQFTVQVADAPSISQTASEPFSLVVPASSTTLEITTVTVPSAQVQTSYSATLSATGGTAPYSWTIASGSLPQGLSLNGTAGTISGTPAATGSSSFTVQVTDSSPTPETASDPLAIGVGSAGGHDWPVHAGGNIQTAITSANLGDTVTLDAGVTFTTGTITLPAKSGNCVAGTYVTIRSSAYASLPSGRIAPSNASLLAKVVGNSAAAASGGVFVVNPGTNGGCYQLLGLEITTDGTTFNTSALVNLQDAGSNHMVVDRCFIHPYEYPNTTPPYNVTSQFGVDISGSDVTVENSYLPGFFGLMPGTQEPAMMVQGDSILIPAGPCNPCLITNNYMEANYAPVILGGADPTGTVSATVLASPAPTLTSATLSSTSGLSVGMPIAFPIPWTASQCERPNSFTCYADAVVTAISGNNITFTTLQGWEGGSGNPTPPASGGCCTSPGSLPITGSAGGVIWSGTQLSGVTITQNWMKHNYAFALQHRQGNGNNPKGYMEIKNGNNLDIEGNVFGEYGGWPSVVGILNSDQNGGAVFSTISNFTFKNNWTIGFWGAIRFQGGGDYSGTNYLSVPSNNVVYSNNLYEQPDCANITGATPNDAFGQALGMNFTFQHNTILTGYGCSDGSVSQFSGAAPGPWAGLATPYLTVKDNLVGWGEYIAGCDAGAMSLCWGKYTESNNYIIRCTTTCQASYGSSGDDPVADGVFPNSTTVQGGWASILFNNMAGHVLSLLPTSPGVGAASDGTDVGVNFAQLQAATAGVNQ